jgi:hypothetical protein
LISHMSHALTYDTLPAHSTLRREFVDGVLKLTAGAEEPGPLVRRAALVRASIAAAWICVAVLLVGFAAFGATYQAHRRLMSWSMSVALCTAFMVFVAMLFLLVLRAQYSARLDLARRALQQNTTIAASPGRLIIETAGPMGSGSYDIRRGLRALRVARAQSLHWFDCLEVLLDDGTSVRLLAGRDVGELNWVARALQSAVTST